MKTEQTTLSELERSRAYSILKTDYGWNGCTDTEDQQEQIAIIISNSECLSCAADQAALYIDQNIGFNSFRKRIDGKPNKRIVLSQIVKTNIGDACATPAHIPEVPGQGGNLILLSEFLNVRTSNIFRDQYGYKYLHQLVKHTEVEFLKLPNFGKYSLTEVKEFLEKHGMSLAPYVWVGKQ